MMFAKLVRALVIGMAIQPGDRRADVGAGAAIDRKLLWRSCPRLTTSIRAGSG